MYRRNEDHNFDFGQAYRKAADYCVIQDRCSSEIELKLNYWNVDKSFTEEILKKLVAEGFLDERRFAVTYASGKFRIKGWGKLKIKAGLRARSIPQAFIQEAIATIDSDEYTAFLKTLLTKKLKQLGTLTPSNIQKAAFFASSRGFEPGLIASGLRNNQTSDI